MSSQSSQAWLAIWFGFCMLVVIFLTNRSSSSLYQTSSENNDRYVVSSKKTPAPTNNIIPCAVEDIITTNSSVPLTVFDAHVKNVLRRHVLNEIPINWLLSRWSTLPYKIKNGTLMEFGVFRGETLNRIWTTMQANSWTGSVHGFDSFEGLPEKWRDNFDAGDFGAKRYGSADLYEQVRARFPAQVSLHRGWFQETLPRVLAASPSLPPLALLHLDADIFSSTIEMFTMLNRHIVPGTYLLFDELINYPGYMQHEMRAFWLWLQYSGASVCTIGVRDIVSNNEVEQDKDSQAALFQVITAPMGMKQY